MGFALARALLLADAVTAEALAQALLIAGSRGTSLVRALLATRAIEPGRLEQQLEGGEAPTMRHVAPVMSLVNQLPPGLCERLLALPVRRDPRTGTVDVAVVDARDPHPVEEIAHWLRAPVRMVRTSLASMETALKRMNAKPEMGVRSLAAPIWVPAPVPIEPPPDLSKTPAYGSPVVDESQLGDSLDSSPTEVVDFGVASPNIPFALKRKSMASISFHDLGAPAVEKDARFPQGRPWSEPPPAPRPPADVVFAPGETDPILDLRRRKTIPPDVAHASTIPAPQPQPMTPSPVVVPHPAPPPAPLPAPSPAPNAPAPPFDDARAVFDAIHAASDRDSILELLVAGARTVARKVAVLAVKRDTLVGWTCSPELGDRSLIRAARVAFGLSDVFSTALASEKAHLARIPKDATHAPLLAVMKSPPRGEVGLVSVRVGDKPVALLMADELGDTALGTRRLQELSAAAGEALERLLRDRRRA